MSDCMLEDGKAKRLLFAQAGTKPPQMASSRQQRRIMIFFSHLCPQKKDFKVNVVYSHQFDDIGVS